MIAAVYGSPRKDGNTDMLMNTFLEQVERKEKVKRFYLRDLEFKPCTACGDCDKTGVCIFRDDVWSIYETIEEASGFVVSSPIYFASISAQLKAFIDRAQPFWTRKFILGQKNTSIKKGFFLSVGAMNTKKHFENAKLIIKAHMNTLDIKYSGELFFPGVDGKGEINSVPGALEKPYLAAEKFIYL